MQKKKNREEADIIALQLKSKKDVMRLHETLEDIFGE